MKKNILFVVDEREMGGVSVVLNDLVHTLDSHKYNIDILVLHNKGNMLNDLPDHVDIFYGTPYFEAIDYTISEVIKMKKFPLLMKKVRIVFDLKTGFIKQSIQRERKKLIHKQYDVEVAFKDGFTALFVGYGNCMNKIHWLHCSYKTFNPNAKYENLFKKVLPLFDHIVGVSVNVVKEFNEIYHLEKITETIPVVMDVERIKKLSQESSVFSVNEDKLNIVLIGRCHPVKGYDRLFDVIMRLKDENMLGNAHFTIFGDGPLFTHLKERISNEKLNGVISMKGAISNPYAELKCYSLLLLPSFSEAFGTVISEAFILDIPVLATETSASLMSVKKGVNGEICENSDEGLYQSLKQLIQHPDAIDQWKNNLKNFNYDNSKILKRIETIFDEGEKI